MDAEKLPAPGDVIAGKYRVERVLGRGGMGIVFAAHHVVLGQRVALKMLLAEHAQRADALQRFVNEARAAAHIESDHVARVMDIGTAADGTPFMVLEYLQGSDLAQLARKRAITPVEAVDFVIQALEGIAQAHAIGIVHRDLKPANLFLAQRPDGTSRIKVLDFGISKADGVMVAPSGITSATTILGSPYYMSPEQLRSAKQVDTRTDVWAIGVILYELIGGRMPFVGESVAEVFTAILDQTPPSIRSENVPEALEAAVFRCFGRPADARYADVAQVAEALAPFASPAGVASAKRVRVALEEGTRRASAKRDDTSSAPSADAHVPSVLPERTLLIDPTGATSRARTPSTPERDPERTIAQVPPLAPSSERIPAGQTSSAWGHASRQGPAPIEAHRTPTPALRWAIKWIAGGVALLAIVSIGAIVARKNPDASVPASPGTIDEPIAAPVVEPPQAPPPLEPVASTSSPAVIDAGAALSPTPSADAGSKDAPRAASPAKPSPRTTATAPQPPPRPTYNPLRDTRR